jgi:hypothetical protein
MTSTPVRDRELAELVESLDAADAALEGTDFFADHLALAPHDGLEIQRAIGRAADFLNQLRFERSDR